MKLFECQNCAQPLYFENTHCESCRLSLGYLPDHDTVTALKSLGNGWAALADNRNTYRYCANAAHNVCNWLVSANSPEQFCAACRHNRVIPDLNHPEHLERWRLIEIAKHRLFYTLLRLRLPLTTKAEDPEGGLAFDCLADIPASPPGTSSVMTGHANGVITINLAEADDAERERRRRQMHEPYRTLLGHFRHEIGHYNWPRLVAGSATLDEFRQTFGDERADYSQALRRYHASGAPADWPHCFVSAYATAHPWEDFAETWAHYFHLVDTLETAGSFGLAVSPKPSKGLRARIDFDPHRASMERLINTWIPLTFAANSLNRSMGLPDLYPFVLSQPAIAKLAFVHARIHAQQERQTCNDHRSAPIAPWPVTTFNRTAMKYHFYAWT